MTIDRVSWHHPGDKLSFGRLGVGRRVDLRHDLAVLDDEDPVRQPDQFQELV
jgi:hypothetical protein